MGVQYPLGTVPHLVMLLIGASDLVARGSRASTRCATLHLGHMTGMTLLRPFACDGAQISRGDCERALRARTCCGGLTLGGFQIETHLPTIETFNASARKAIIME